MLNGLCFRLCIFPPAELLLVHVLKSLLLLCCCMFTFGDLFGTDCLPGRIQWILIFLRVHCTPHCTHTPLLYHWLCLAFVKTRGWFIPFRKCRAGNSCSTGSLLSAGIKNYFWYFHQSSLENTNEWVWEDLRTFVKWWSVLWHDMM